MMKLRQESALNLSLKGTTGTFRVGTGRSGQTSLEVKYLLTHVGLNFATGDSDQLMSSLEPVREMFDPQTLEFEEIMQRDIDDARVSAELVPYLLDDQAQEMIKLFPPIVVVVLPSEDVRNKPAERYPKVTREELPPTTEREYPVLSTRAGAIGREIFQFEQPVPDGIPLTNDFVRLRLNTNKVRLVIVDGQHRAMALLAIYRNLKDEWTDERRAPFREYYAEWTPNYIQQFNLDQIQLPVMLCTIPDIDEDFKGDFDLKKAARSIFLTLNKNARKVSDSRNKLLDDNDLIAHFMRICLSEIKKKDLRSEYSTRIWNVELDQHRDKVKLQSAVAMTGVSHVYYVIEHLMLETDTVTGIGPRVGKFSMRTDLDGCLRRLDGRNLLGQSATEAIKRDQYSEDSAKQLGDSFKDRYANYLIAIFDRFSPFDLHCRATLEVHDEVEKTDLAILPILFDGQGVLRVFEAHRSNVKQKLKEKKYKTDVPAIQNSANRLDGTAIRIEDTVSTIQRKRAEHFIARIGDKNKFYDAGGQIHKHIIDWINGLYDNVFTTVAFQSALICGFFAEIDRARVTDDSEALFDQYITQMSDFFAPTSVSKFRQLLQVFYGEIQGDTPVNWIRVPSNQTFRHVVYRAEMQPVQWPRYKYLMLEAWKPNDEFFKISVDAERKRCRDGVFRELHEWYADRYCSDNRKSKDELLKEENDEIFTRSYEAFKGFLTYLGVGSSLRISDMKMALKTKITLSTVDSEDSSLAGSDEQPDEIEE